MIHALVIAAALLAGQASPDEVRRGARLGIDGKYEEAAEHFRGLLARDPDNGVLHYYLGISYLKQRRHELAAEHFEEAVEEQVGFPKAYEFLADAYWVLDKKEKALEAVEAGLKRFERNERLIKLHRLIRAGLGR